MAETLENVTTKKVNGSRGEYYDWCALLDNDTLVFGDEQGNYAGGAWLSYTFYGDPRPHPSYPDDHIPDNRYWKSIAKQLNYWKEKDNDFYSKILDMCQKHHSKVFDKINEFIH